MEQAGFIFSTPEFILKPGFYKFYLNITASQSPYILTLKTRDNVIFSKKVHNHGKLISRFEIKDEKEELFLSLYYEGQNSDQLFFNNFELRFSE